MREAAKKVGLFHQLPERVGGLVVGRQVAVSAFVEALAKYGARYQYDLFCPGLQRAPIQAGLDAITTPSASRPLVDAHDQRDLLQQPHTMDFAAWHDTQFDTYRPFALRSRMAQHFPISIVHHTLSYPNLLHDTFLRLLLNRPCSYDTIVCTSSAAKEVVAHLLEHVSSSFNEQYGTRLAYQGRLEVIPLGVDTERFKPRDKKALRSRFEVPQDAFVLLWIGRLSAVDKADLIPLVHMFADLVRENPDRNLMLVCAGSEHPAERFGEFVQACAGALNISNYVQVRSLPAQEAPLLHAAADVFVAPIDNLQESFGLTPVEAMACGVPVVVSDWNGYKDTVRHEETGFLIPTLWAPVARDISAGAFLGDAPFDHFALAQSVVVNMDRFQEAVQRLIDHEALRDKMGTRARQHVEACFSWEVVIAQYEALWEELVAQCQAMAQPASTAPAYAKPIYGRAFPHYASETLSDDLVVMLSPRGQQYVHGKGHMPLHQQLGKAIDAAILQRILKGVIYAETHHQHMSVARLVSVITARLPEAHAEDVVRRHVLWLLKYGYLHVIRQDDHKEAG